MKNIIKNFLQRVFISFLFSCSSGLEATQSTPNYYPFTPYNTLPMVCLTRSTLESTIVHYLKQYTSNPFFVTFFKTLSKQTISSASLSRNLAKQINLPIAKFLLANKESQELILATVKKLLAGCTSIAAVKFTFDVRTEESFQENPLWEVPHANLFKSFFVVLKNYQNYVNFMPTTNNVFHSIGIQSTHLMLPWIDAVEPDALQTVENISHLIIDKMHPEESEEEPSQAKQQTLTRFKIFKTGFLCVRVAVTLYQLKQKHMAKKTTDTLIPYMQTIIPCVFDCFDIYTTVTETTLPSILQGIKNICSIPSALYLTDELIHNTIQSSPLPEQLTIDN